jgi:hypothetical protein
MCGLPVHLSSRRLRVIDPVESGPRVTAASELQRTMSTRPHSRRGEAVCEENGERSLCRCRTANARTSARSTNRSPDPDLREPGMRRASIQQLMTRRGIPVMRAASRTEMGLFMGTSAPRSGNPASGGDQVSGSGFRSLRETLMDSGISLVMAAARPRGSR